MRKYRKILPLTAWSVLLFSCTDYDMKEFTADKPESILEREYLDSFDHLKSYVDRNQNPDFRLGAGTGLADYTGKGVMYRLLNDNFDEIVTGWEMKHGAIVQSDGSLNLNDVETLIETAREAGIFIYGHTLCWHANQNAAYLNSLIAPSIIEPEPGEPETIEYVSNGGFESGNINGWYTWQDPNNLNISAPGEGYQSQYAFVLSNSQTGLSFWEVSAMYNFSENLVQDIPCTLKFMVKGSVPGTIRPALYDFNTWSGADFASAEITTQWSEVTVTTTVGNANQALIFNFGDYIGQIYIDDISLTQDVLIEEDPYVLEPSVIKASDFEDQDMGAWYAWGDANPSLSISPAGEGYQGGYALKLTNTSTDMADWQGQFGYDMPENFEKGFTYQLNMRVKGTVAGSLPAAVQLMVPPYPSDGFSGRIEVTTDWTEVELTVNVTDSDRDHFLISVGHYVGTIWFDDITLCKRINTNLIEKTPEEKREIIDQALETFIAGMMETASGYVKAWDVVNEPMSDWPDPSQLKTGVGNNNLSEDEFYWQDYLGKEYAARAIQLARKHGGDDLILFINDYGLEGAADQAKTRGLIDFVDYTEQQGVRVDGIGTQMHVTYGQTELDNIKLMFENLAATGKLIKVSELDMGYYSAEEGRSLKTDELTKEQHQQMADFYREILDAYFDLIPAGQRYGITQWCPLDSPAESGWRAGEPTGLWNTDYARKYTYIGFASGLAGRDISGDKGE